MTAFRSGSQNGSRILIKLGGSILKDQNLIYSLCEDLRRVQSMGISIVIVHGGGPAINEELTRRGIQWEFYQGQRVTTDEMMDVIEMVLCGKVNRQIVRGLNFSGIQALGLSGTDAQLLFCSPVNGVLGRVGSVQSIHDEMIASILEQQPSVIPVIAPVGVDSNGNALNLNADWAASKLAQSLGVEKLIYLTDQNGILDENGESISELGSDKILNLIESGVVTGGMLAKAQTVWDALQNGIPEVHIINANRPYALSHSLGEELNSHQSAGHESAGTVCKSQVELPIQQAQ